MCVLFVVFDSLRPQSGSLTSLTWTPDGTQLAAAGGNGSVVFGQVIERSLEWDIFEVRRSLQVFSPGCSLDTVVLG